MTTECRIGISGWKYKPWRGVFYPKGLRQKDELQYVAGKMNSVEINGTFYSLQRPSSYEKWSNETPDNFVFALKGPRFISHLRRLKDIRTPLANFFASGPLLLGDKLGPILWQFPAHFPYDEQRFSDFLKLLPKSTTKAAELASEYTIPKDRVWLGRVGRKRLRYAFEMRHPSFFEEGFFQLLRRYNAALVLADTAGKFPYFEDVTADFVYVRLHGAEELYASGYKEEQLRWWAARLGKWRDGGQPRGAKLAADKQTLTSDHRDIYVYFDNDIKVHAPFDAIKLAELLGPSCQGP